MMAPPALIAEGRWTTPTDAASGFAQLLREAADHDTSPWRLAALADDPDTDVRIAVAANPSASMLTVLRLRRDRDPRVRLVVSMCRDAGRWR